MTVVPPQAAPDAPRYARFSRRLRGMLIDFMLFLLAMVAALQIAVALNSDDLARMVGFGFIAAFFLYEPLMVSIMGGTVGHYLSNLRVVDDRSNGNVSLPKAVLRVVIKAVLGWYSFLSMTVARRHQAVHDLLTRSTVQVRDPAKALPHHFARERVELSTPGMPSRLRRVLVIVLYLLAALVLLALAIDRLVQTGLYSAACIDAGYCSSSDRLVESLVGVLFLAVCALCIGGGWRGLLWGARRVEGA